MKAFHTVTVGVKLALVDPFPVYPGSKANLLTHQHTQIVKGEGAAKDAAEVEEGEPAAEEEEGIEPEEGTEAPETRSKVSKSIHIYGDVDRLAVCVRSGLEDRQVFGCVSAGGKYPRRPPIGHEHTFKGLHVNQSFSLVLQCFDTSRTSGSSAWPCREWHSDVLTFLLHCLKRLTQKARTGEKMTAEELREGLTKTEELEVCCACVCAAPSARDEQNHTRRAGDSRLRS